MEAPQYLLRDVPLEERPRERMMNYGAEALSHAELLAILLRTGTKDESVMHLANRIMRQVGSIRQLVDLSIEELTEIKGIGTAKAIQIKAGIELGRRITRTGKEEVKAIRSPRDAADLLIEQLRYLQKEHFVCLFLNTKNHIISQETLSMGSLNASIVHPREVFRAAIKCSSASVIFAHNHPSGDPTPSPEDVALTKRLVDAGKIIGIEVLDHLVIGDMKFVSLKEQGLM
ncbi:DNA repair protein RadC [Paenibacillus sp. PsM32]|uniref:DNA repair protein RadC n=2 Tax=Paenibacillus TaxID=44249 RepID=A0ABW4UPN7_9BACL|nr:MULTISPECIES: DNA repair protein RadC [Paenibacillus]MDN4619726.1 DNA repair protein RadC [Paenibacillus sp. PsM32]MDQ1235369.1 DNA repair protein RadC [Paenibacillus sp. SORGH_AS_0306]MDR6112417.1 DNA repair protein RadC [Paenibacillus sp. SORGH_AS_0338]WCT54910.1 DNA repair protein RadC [Paenibacillus kyungheensis]WDF51948.1 DNA repair protein RadC [Paenibacillus sp. KACC 21273]